MPDHYVVTISKTLHQKVGEESDRLEMNRKEIITLCDNYDEK